jgi:integrase
MAEKFNFTQASISKLPLPPTGRLYYTDAKTPGLSLCVWDTGVKTFELYKRIGGRPTRLKIGRFPEISVEQARKTLSQMIGEISKGNDPAADRRKARNETTVGELFNLYLENHAKPYKRTWKEDQSQFLRYLTEWKTRQLSQIRRADVAAMHAKIGKTAPYAANRVLGLLSVMFNYAAGLGYEGGNPANGVRKFKEQSRDRFLRADEIQAFFQSLQHAETPEVWRDFFTIALLTGARRANVEAMKWVDVELQRGLWKISETESKNSEPLLCVLAPHAVEILKRRDADNTAQNKPSEYVFSSWGSTGHVTEPKSAWKRIVGRAQIKDIRLHDLRRTLGSWQAAAGASLSIIGKSLGHKNIATTAIYARLDLDPVRASVNTAATAIMAAANGPRALPAPANMNTGGGKTLARKSKQVKAKVISIADGPEPPAA